MSLIRVSLIRSFFTSSLDCSLLIQQTNKKASPSTESLGVDSTAYRASLTTGPLDLVIDNIPITMDGKIDGLIPGSPTGRTPRNFRPAWAKDGGTFGPATGAYDPNGSDPANDFAELNLAGPGGRPATAPMIPVAPSLGSVGGGSAWGSSGVGFDGGLERRSVSGGGGGGVKKTIRLSREQIVAARKPTKVLPEMVDKMPADVVLTMPLSPELLSPMDERTMQRIWQDAGRSTSGGSGGAPPRGASGIGSGGAERRGLGRGAGKGGSPGLGPVQGGDSPNFGPVAGGGGLGGAAWRSSSSSQRGIDPWSKDKRERSPLVGPSGNSSLTSSLEGGFNLDLPAHADSGRWSRGLKVGELQPATQLKSGSGGFFDNTFGGDGDSDGDGGLEDVDDKGDGMLDLNSLSNAALSFEQEKRRMHDLFAGGDGDGLAGGGFASGLGTGGGSSSLLGDPAVLSTRAPPPNPTNSRAQALAPTSAVTPQPPQSHEALSGSVAGLFATVSEKPTPPPAASAAAAVARTQPAPAPVAPAPAASAPAAVETDVGAPPLDWFYSDPNGVTQGPFKADQMKAWQKGGYFDTVPDLPVRCGNSGPFRPLSSLSAAFENSPSGKASVQQQQQEAQQQQKQQQQQQQKQQQAEAKAQAKKAAEEKAKAEASAAAAAKAAAEEEAARKEKAAAEVRAQQQKKALEEQQQKELEQQQRARAAKSAADSAPITKAPWAASSSSNGQSRDSGGSLAQIQAAEAAAAAAAAAASAGQVDQLKAMLGVSSSSAKSGGSAWGGKGAPPVVAAAAGAPPNSSDSAGRAGGPSGNGGAGAGRSGGAKSKSLVEIQQEEARIAAARKAAEPQKSSGGHWAAMASSAPAPSALAKGNLVAWNSVASSSTSPPPSVSSMAPPPAAPAPRAVAQQAPAGGGGGNSSGFTPVRPNNSGGGSTAAAPTAARAGNHHNNPGANLEAWCGEQLQKLTGSSDMTLIHFCLSLSDPSEIRSYFSAYLGAKPEVSHFATEFIKRKHDLRHGGGGHHNNGGAKPGQAAAGRKGKKK